MADDGMCRDSWKHMDMAESERVGEWAMCVHQDLTHMQRSVFLWLQRGSYGPAERIRSFGS